MENLDRDLETFMINDLIIDYSLISDDLPDGIPANGQFIEVQGEELVGGKGQPDRVVEAIAVVVEIGPEVDLLAREEPAVEVRVDELVEPVAQGLLLGRADVELVYGRLDVRLELKEQVAQGCVAEGVRSYEGVAAGSDRQVNMCQ